MGLTSIGIHRIAAAAAPLVITMLWVAVGYAQSPVITASVDRNDVTTDETVTLSVVVQSATGAPAPSLPSLKGLMVVGRSTESKLTIVNGKATGNVTFRFVLRPLEPGKLTIGPIRVTLDGGSHMTESIYLDVKRGLSVAAGQTPQEANAIDRDRQGEAPLQSSLSSDQELFVDAEIDHPEVYQGQQVTYLLRFYRKLHRLGRQRVGQPSYDEPAFNGFWSNNDSEQTRYETRLEGQRYLVTEVRTVLFPTVTGLLTIGPASLMIPGGVFEHDMILRSEPVTVNVLPLPDEAPNGFTGAVGRFEISARSSSSHSQVNKPITLTLTLSGEGNINTLPDLVWPNIPGWRGFDTSSTVSSRLTDGRLSGSRTYERLMIPGKAGDFTIPPTKFVYFDPQAGKYRTVSTEPVLIIVAQGSQPVSDQGSATGSSKTVDLETGDIRHIKPVPSRLDTADEPLSSQVAYWAVWAALLALLAGGTAWKTYGSRLKAKAGLTHRERASITAIRALETAETHGVDPYRISDHVLLEYMSARLGESLNGLTYTELADLLATRGIGPILARRVVSCLAAGERRFASERGATEPSGLLDETRSVITDLERSLAT